MSTEDLRGDLTRFLADSPTPWHAVACVQKLLDQSASVQQNEVKITRVDGTLIASHIVPDTPVTVLLAHTDSPCLRLKSLVGGDSDGIPSVEVYGGALLNPWFDRDLAIAGRVVIQEGSKLVTVLIDSRRPVAIIPSLAIHLDRNVNRGREVNAQIHLRPLWGGELSSNRWVYDLVTSLAGGEPVEAELCLYDSAAPASIGIDEALLASARLDNLLSTFICSQAFIAGVASGARSVVLACYDHEEVGSLSRAGAQSRLLADALEPCRGYIYDECSLSLSVDNAHAQHQNFSDRHDPVYAPKLGAGPVVKLHASGRYASTPLATAILRKTAKEAGVALQTFHTRSDLACGSTVGPMTAAETGLNTVDLGVPQLAMHSIREVAHWADIEAMQKLLCTLTQKS